MAIDFTLAPEHEEIRARVRTFIRDTVQPRIKGFDDEEKVTSRHDYLVTILELREEAKRAGLWLPHMPEEWGGMGLGHVELAMVQAEAGKDAPRAVDPQLQAPDEGNMHTLLHWGTDDQKEKYLRPLCEGTSHVVLRHDRARGGRLRSDPHTDPGRARTGTSGSSTATSGSSRTPAGPGSPSSWPGPSRMCRPDRVAPTRRSWSTSRPRDGTTSAKSRRCTGRPAIPRS